MNIGFDPHSLEILKLLHPCVAARAQVMNSFLEVDPVMVAYHDELHITQGGRSFQLQATYWAQGRYPLVVVNQKRAEVNLAPIMEQDNNIITHAMPGYGWHEYFLAIDVCPFEYDKDPDWNEKHPAWQRIVIAGQQAGFKAGATFATFHDGPHFHPIELSAKGWDTPPAEVRAHYAVGGIPAVHAFLNLPNT